MTPPIRMVSVPPNVLESIAFNLCSLHDFDPAFVHQNEKFALATITEYLRAQPAAAPVREEGGAVWNPHQITPNDIAAILDESAECYDHGGGLCNASQLAEKIWRAGLSALATRHEAPAEAGEIGAEYDDAAHCVTLAACPPGLFLWNGTLGFKSEYGAMEPVGISPHHQQWKVGNRVDAYCADSGEYFWGGTSNHDDRAKLLVYPISAEAVAMVASHGLSALRAHPPAREDAQPVASAYRVRPEMNDPEEWTLMHPERAFDYLDRPGWETQPLYTHPAPDALRVALSDAMVEAACSRFVSESDDIWSDSVWPEGPDDDGDRGDGGRVRLISEADQHNIRSAMRFAMTDALAALQAEQKGGAA